MYIMKQKEMYNIWKYHLSLNKLLLSIWNWFTTITFRNNDYENQWSTWAHWYSSCGLASTGNGKMAGFEFSTVKSITNIANTKFFPWGSRGSQNKRGDRVIHAIGKPIQHFPCSTGRFPFNQLIGIFFLISFWILFKGWRYGRWVIWRLLWRASTVLKLHFWSFHIFSYTVYYIVVPRGNEIMAHWSHFGHSTQMGASSSRTCSSTSPGCAKK